MSINFPTLKGLCHMYIEPIPVFVLGPKVLKFENKNSKTKILVQEYEKPYLNFHLNN